MAICREMEVWCEVSRLRRHRAEQRRDYESRGDGPPKGTSPGSSTGATGGGATGTMKSTSSLGATKQPAIGAARATARALVAPSPTAVASVVASTRKRRHTYKTSTMMNQERRHRHATERAASGSGLLNRLRTLWCGTHLEKAPSRGVKSSNKTLPPCRSSQIATVLSSSYATTHIAAACQ